MSAQPKWKYNSSQGDVDPITYGGQLVLVDTSDVYPPEVINIEPPNDSIDLDSPKARWTVHRAVLDRCTFIGGVLSDNKFHPDHSAWFADSIKSICSYNGQLDLIDLLCSEDPSKLALGYICIAQYHGWENLDSYPDVYTRAEIEEYYKKWISAE